jgi:hypothetical protein
VRKHGLVKANGDQSFAHRATQARILHSSLARQPNRSTAIAHAHMSNRTAERERHAHALWTARSRLTRVQLLARWSREAGRALTLKFGGANLDALGAILTWQRTTQRGHLVREVAAFRVRVEDGVFGTVHDGELAKAVADDEFGRVTRASEELA